MFLGQQLHYLSQGAGLIAHFDQYDLVFLEGNIEGVEYAGRLPKIIREHANDVLVLVVRHRNGGNVDSLLGEGRDHLSDPCRLAINFNGELLGCLDHSAPQYSGEWRVVSGEW